MRREKLAYRVWTRLTERDARLVEALADDEGRPVCNMIRRLVEESLRRRGYPESSAQAAGIEGVSELPREELRA